VNSDNFSPTKANRAQIKYCDEHECPVFAPMNGVCYRCGYNIYLRTNGKSGPRGITVEEAGSRLITSCPHCGYSFVE